LIRDSIPGFISNSSSKVCGSHFDKSQILGGSRKFLAHNANPFVQLQNGNESRYEFEFADPDDGDADDMKIPENDLQIEGSIPIAIPNDGN
jgi:hypothetical protein